LAQSTVPTGTASKPARLTGVLAALVVLGVVMFALPPTSRLWVAGVVVVMALLVRGGDAAKLIDEARKRIYGE
jgi:hypothetical protein